jgi:hypothetical protein
MIDGFSEIYHASGRAEPFKKLMDGGSSFPSTLRAFIGTTGT